MDAICWCYLIALQWKKAYARCWWEIDWNLVQKLQSPDGLCWCFLRSISDLYVPWDKFLSVPTMTHCFRPSDSVLTSWQHAQRWWHQRRRRRLFWMPREGKSTLEEAHLAAWCKFLNWFTRICSTKSRNNNIKARSPYQPPF